MKTIDSVAYHNVVTKMRSFFEKKGFIEVPTQSRLSILAACEDPTTIAIFAYSGQSWPLPQTGQMWLEYELLNNPKVPGFFCISTSYRNEANPIPGRHDLIFPMIEFETRGGITDLLTFNRQIVDELSICKFMDIISRTYEDLAKKYGVKELTHEHEKMIWRDYGQAVMLTNFPEHTSPFWNMKRNTDGTSQKIDAILYGIETIGSSVRATDPVEMRKSFYTISDGKYADTLFAQFGKERVEKELENFLSLPFVPRFGGGIGVTRLIRACDLCKFKFLNRYQCANH